MPTRSLRTALRRALLAAAPVAIALATPLATPLAAQVSAPLGVPVRPHRAWRTLDTPNYRFHYPADLEAWTRRQAERMETVGAAVRRIVGYAPARVTVLVDDPYNQSNGSAWPFLDAPQMFLWPVPPDPRSVVGDSRDWGELLLVHEFAHLAHLTRPSRNPLRRAVGRVVPAALSPIAVGAPRWVYEGYATYVEGRLTGSGRPHGTWRPAVLRQWAVEGKLPTYAQVNGTAGFFGGSFAYLAGSAYLEWLVERHAGTRGDSALAHLWRRMTARTPRSFDAAFAGVFPGTPAELYARWTAEVTSEALAQERRLRAAGLEDGELVQRLAGYTGDPAVSPDGRFVAVELRPPGRSPRIVVWRTAPDPPDTTRARRLAAARRRDPEDVPAIQYLPPPKRAVETLPRVNGRAFSSPRFLPGGRELVVVREEPRRDGSVRPDLWLWNRESGALRRLTHGAAVRSPDPSPDGRTALGVRCLSGWCDVVRVDLRSGALTTVLAGAPDRSYARPRWAPDGRRFVASEQRAGRWRLVVAGVAGEPPSTFTPDDGADRYDAAFLPGEEAIVAVSEAGGVANLERIDLATGATRPLTRVTGAAVAPTPIPNARAIYFLSLRSQGLDMRRLALDSAARAADVVALTPPAVDTAGAERLSSVAVIQRPVRGAPAFGTARVGGPRAYGAGPRRLLILPVASASADGASAGGFAFTADPVGRLSVLLQGAAGDGRTWNGGALSAAWRGHRPTVEAQAFGVAQRIAPPDGAPAAPDAAPAFRDRFRYHGGVVALNARHALSAGSVGARVGASLGTLNVDLGGSSRRTIGFGELRGSVTRGRGDLLATLGGVAHLATGATADSSFSRAVATGTLAVRSRIGGVRGEYGRGAVARAAPAFERLLVGGTAPTLVDPGVVSQRVPMPALPTGVIVGREVETVRGAITGALIEPYWWAGRVPGGERPWHRVVGLDARFASGAMPFARAPGVDVVAGVGYSLDAPLRRQVRGYLSAVIRP